MYFDLDTVLQGFILYILSKSQDGLTEKEIETETKNFLEYLKKVIDI